MLEKKIEEKLSEQKKMFDKKLSDLQFELQKLIFCPHTFTMEHFSREKAKNKFSDWKSPPMYTHYHGYKFCIGIDANGYRDSRGNGVNVELWVMKGEYDAELKWPAKAKFTIELINHFKNGDNKKATLAQAWDEPKRTKCLKSFNTDPRYNFCFIKHCELDLNPHKKTHFLANDSLHFAITNITILN